VSGRQEQALAAIYHALTGGRNWLEEKHVGEEFDQLLKNTFKKDRYALKAFTDKLTTSNG